MRIAATLLICLPMLAIGCTKGPPPAPSSTAQTAAASPPNASATISKTPAQWTANEILQQLLATYRAAKTYQDEAVVRLSFRQAGHVVSQEQPSAVAFERPRK